MKRTLTLTIPLLLTLMMAMPTLTTAGTADAVTFGKKTFPKGLTYTETETFHLVLSARASVNGEFMDEITSGQDKDTFKQVSVLSMDGDLPSLVKVAYRRDHESSQTGTETTTEPSVAEGRTYYIRYGADGAPEVLDTVMNPAPDDEAAYVAADLGRPGTQDELMVYLSGQTLRPGQRVEPPAALMDSILGDTGGMPVGEFSMTFTGTRVVGGIRTGVFALVLRMGGDLGEGLALSMDFSGEALFALDSGWPVSVSLEGTATMHGNDPSLGLTMSGGGEGKILIAMEYYIP